MKTTRGAPPSSRRERRRSTTPRRTRRMLLDQSDAACHRTDRPTPPASVHNCWGDDLEPLPLVSRPPPPRRPTSSPVGGNADTRPNARDSPRSEALTRSQAFGTTHNAQVITARRECFVDQLRQRLPPHAHLGVVSLANRGLRTIQCPSPVTRRPHRGKGNPYLRARWATPPPRPPSDTFLGERYRRIVQTPRQVKALVARSPPAPSWSSLEPDSNAPPPLAFHTRTRTRDPTTPPTASHNETHDANHIAQLTAMGIRGPLRNRRLNPNLTPANITRFRTPPVLSLAHSPRAIFPIRNKNSR